jgi:cytoskeleton protein RodZ
VTENNRRPISAPAEKPPATPAQEPLSPNDAVEPLRVRSAPGPGAILRAAREAQELTREEVADALHLLVRVVADLEDENWRRLPNPTFTRGYYRAYAKLLELDVDKVLNAYRAAAPAPEPDGSGSLRGSARAPRSTAMRSSVGPILALIVAGLIAAAVVFVVWQLWPDALGERSAAPFAGPQAQAPAVPRGQMPLRTPPPPLPAAEQTRQAVVEPVVALPGESPLEDSAAGDHVLAFAPAEDDGEAADWGESLPLAVRPERRLTPAGDDRLRFVFSDDCWVDVKALDGRTLYSALSRAGDELELVGQGPFRVLLGYAPAVELSFNGQDVPVRAQMRNNVASLTLGR